MFFSKIEKNLIAKENRHDLAAVAAVTMNGSVRISFFQIAVIFLLKADFQNQSYFL